MMMSRRRKEGASRHPCNQFYGKGSLQNRDGDSDGVPVFLHARVECGDVELKFILVTQCLD